MGSDAGSVRRGMAARRIRFLARSRSSARGFTADFLAYDEALILASETVGASMPTMAARPNPQLWYTSSEGRIDAFQLARVRRRGLRGCLCGGCAKARKGAPPAGEASLMYAEWSGDLCTAECLAGCDQHDDPADPAVWRKANPGYGIRIEHDYLAKVFQSMDADQFAAAHLAFSEWPQDENRWAVITEGAWDACADEATGRPGGQLAIAADASPDGAQACVAIAGVRADGKVVGEIPEGDHRPGTAWVVPRLVELKRKYRSRIRAIVIDPSGPAAPLIAEAENARLEITKPTARDTAQAYGLFYIAVKDREFVHLGGLQPNLRAAVANAVDRDTGDGLHAWARKSAKVDISPLVAVTLAVWGHDRFCRRAYDPLSSVPG
jgi:phage terminase large subunit-like protein